MIDLSITLTGRILAALAIAWVMALSPASAQVRAAPRIALVIANSAYTELPALENAAKDGVTIASALTAARFQDASGQGPVRPRYNLDAAAIRKELQGLSETLARAGPEAFAVVYFSGHGAGIGSYGDAALAPVDVRAGSSAALITRAALTDQLLGTGAKTVVVILDMCRSVLEAGAAPPQASVRDEDTRRPIATRASDGVQAKGITRFAPSQRRPDQGFLVAYSTSPDQVAFDSGVFSRVLAEEIRRPAQNVAEVFKRVSDRVALASGGRTWQKPTFDYGLQGETPCFVSCDPNADTARFYDCANCPWMRIIPAGEAVLGSAGSDKGRARGERSLQAVRMARPFALSVFEVTLSEWAACVLDGACRTRPTWAKDNPNPLIPATHLSFRDAEDYVGWMSQKAGRTYRLPTEDEWEYAARAGGATAFAFGDEISPALANYDHTARYGSSPTGPYRGYPEAVTNYPANAFGLAQMEGNAWEWTSGCDGESSAGCGRRVLRGGSFQSEPVELRLAGRFAIAPDKVRIDVGLRVARDLEPSEFLR